MNIAALPSRNRLGLTILCLALPLGVLGDQVLRAMPWGLNLTVCVIALVVAGAWVVHRHRIPVSADAPWLALTVLLCAVAFVRRDSLTLRALDLVALAVFLGFAALAVQGASLRLRGVSAYVIATCTAAAHAWFGALRLVIGDIAWGTLPIHGRWRDLGAVGIGLAIAAPLLLLFGGLLVSADASFESFVTSFRFDITRIASHVFFAGVCAALVAGYLRGAVLGDADVAARVEQLSPPGVRFATTATVLGALDLLFLLFLSVQARWLFGGADTVAATTGLTVAEYARRGFFELVTVAALVLPLLLVADWATQRDTPQQRTSFRALSVLTVLLVGALMGSALQRMLLYVQSFGLTDQRFYTTAFMVWLAGVFGWFVWTVLRGARARFAFGALVQGMALLAGLHLLNPDAFITRTNAARAAVGTPFDAAYAAGELSADAVPALLHALPRLGEAERREVAKRLLARWGGPSTRDWRSWNWSVSRARALVHARNEALTVTAGPAPH
jgi:hypothetical protein